MRGHRRGFLARASPAAAAAGLLPAASRYAAKELLVRPFATLIVPFRTGETLRHPALGLFPPRLVVLLLAFGAAGSDGATASNARRSATGMVLGSVPVLAYFYVDPDLSGSRYVYLALTGWVLLLATSAASLSARRPRDDASPCLIALWMPGDAESSPAVAERGGCSRTHSRGGGRSCGPTLFGLDRVRSPGLTLDGVPLFRQRLP